MTYYLHMMTSWGWSVANITELWKNALRKSEILPYQTVHEGGKSVKAESIFGWILEAFKN